MLMHAIYSMAVDQSYNDITFNVGIMLVNEKK